MDGVLQRCNIRLSNYVSNIECKSYRDVVRRLSEGVTNPNELMKLVHGRIVNRHGAETILASLTGVVSQAEIDVLRQLHEEIDIAESHRNECQQRMLEICEKHFPEELERLLKSRCKLFTPQNAHKHWGFRRKGEE